MPVTRANRSEGSDETFSERYVRKDMSAGIKDCWVSDLNIRFVEPPPFGVGDQVTSAARTSTRLVMWRCGIEEMRGLAQLPRRYVEQPFGISASLSLLSPITAGWKLHAACGRAIFRRGTESFEAKSFLSLGTGVSGAFTPRTIQLPVPVEFSKGTNILQTLTMMENNKARGLR